jgi:hypothetical protein
VGECLYRYSSNGVYYARFESGGKEIRRSLRTTDRASAQRALAWLKQERQQVDPTQGKLTLGELCDRYTATIQHQKPKTIERKSLIIRRVKSHWSTGRLTQVTKVKPSHVDLWISRYRFGPHSRNLHMACIKEIFEMAVRDGTREYPGCCCRRTVAKRRAQRRCRRRIPFAILMVSNAHEVLGNNRRQSQQSQLERGLRLSD